MTVGRASARAGLSAPHGPAEAGLRPKGRPTLLTSISHQPMTNRCPQERGTVLGTSLGTTNQASAEVPTRHAGVRAPHPFHNLQPIVQSSKVRGECGTAR